MLKYDANQPARRKLATKLMVLSEGKHPDSCLHFGAALVAINAEMENIGSRWTLNELWDRWALIHDCLLVETDATERQRLAFMLALVGTAINEIRANDEGEL